MEDQKELTKKTRYNIQYAKEKIKRVPLDMQLSAYEELRAAADAVGERVNTYIKKAIAERMERDSAGATGSTVARVQSPEGQQEAVQPAQPAGPGDGSDEAGVVSISPDGDAQPSGPVGVSST